MFMHACTTGVLNPFILTVCPAMMRGDCVSDVRSEDSPFGDATMPEAQGQPGRPGVLRPLRGAPVGRQHSDRIHQKEHRGC